MLREALTIAAKDLLVEVRTKERLAALVLFSLVVVLSFRFSFELFGVHDGGLAQSHFLVPAVLWVTVVFSATLGMLTVFSKEEENRCIEGLLLAPASRNALYVGKLVSSFASFVVIALLTMLFLGAFLPYDYRGQYLPVVGLLVLGTFAYTALGVTAAAVSASSRMREVLLPVIMIPIALFTVIVPSIAATSDVLLENLSGALDEVRFVAFSSVLFVGVSLLVFDYLWEA